MLLRVRALSTSLPLRQVRHSALASPQANPWRGLFGKVARCYFQRLAFGYRTTTQRLCPSSAAPFAPRPFCDGHFLFLAKTSGIPLRLLSQSISDPSRLRACSRINWARSWLRPPGSTPCSDRCPAGPSTSRTRISEAPSPSPHKSLWPRARSAPTRCAWWVPLRHRPVPVRNGGRQYAARQHHPLQRGHRRIGRD
jgi:hypothetical protein